LKRNKLEIYLIVMLFLLACGAPANVATTTPSELPGQAVLPTDTPIPSPPPTEPPPPTATLPPDQICVHPQAHSPLEAGAFDNYPGEILGFLNAGGTVDDLIQNLNNLEIANEPPTAQWVDLTGDGRNDVALSIINRESQYFVPEGMLLVYTCQASEYVLTYIQLSDDFFGAPAIIHVRDLNDDGLNELIISSPGCGAHTCFEDTRVLSWSGTAFENHLEGNTTDLPFPDVQITDYDQDRIYSLEVVGKGFGSVGAGPQREVTHIWDYDPANGIWVMTEEHLGVSSYRIHMVHDADEALERGEYEVALLLYNQAFNDPGLKDWADPVTEQRNIGAYARFKSIVAYLYLGDIDTATSFFVQMGPIFPEEFQQHAFVQMAQLLINSYVADGSIVGGCKAAEDFAAEHADVILEPLGPAYFGYANREFTPDDICP
jgi:hypothetical protein